MLAFIGDQEVHLAAMQIGNAVREVVGSEPRDDRPERFLECLQPGGKEAPADGMLRTEGHHVLVRLLEGFTDLIAFRLDAVDGLVAGLEHLPPGLGELDGVARAVDEGRADPGLQRPDAAAERRLTDVVDVGGLGEIARARETGEVLEPLEIHRAGLLAGRVGMDYAKFAS